MTLPSTQFGFNALLRAIVATAGTVAAVGFGAWPAATGCFAMVTIMALQQLRRAERRERTWRTQARRDPLAGGDSRRLHDRLHDAVSADPHRFALLTLDLDRFKQIDEDFGHLEADRLLEEVGKALLDNVRDQDVVAREGRDAFSVLLHETDEAGAAVLAERIERALERIEAADAAPVQASIGVAVYPDHGRTPADLLEKAGTELRRTKAQRTTSRAGSASEPARTAA